MQQAQGGLTSQEIIDLLNSDFEFAVNFIIDNNPSAVESNLSALSIPLPQNPSNLQLREAVDSILQNGQDPDAVSKFEEVISVPYIDNTPNYTAGFSSYFASKMPPAPNNASVTLAVIGAVSGLLGVAGSVWNSYKQEDLAELQQEMLNEQYAYELDRIERTKILGIPQTIFIAVIGFVMVVIILLFLSRKK